MAPRRRAVATSNNDSASDTGEDKDNNAEETKVKARPRPKPLTPLWVPFLLSAVVAVTIPVIVLKYWLPPLSQRLWYPHQLAKYDGSDEKLPVYLAIFGEVYDVTEGRKHYGKGGDYNHFAGRDATLSFVTGETSEEALTDDVSSLTTEDFIGLDSWRQFYPKTYKAAGMLVGRYIDKEGFPTDELKRVWDEFEKAKELVEKRKEDEARFPNCNSKWSQAEGGEVWCDHGFPRKVFRVGSNPSSPSPSSRCGCFGEGDTGRPDQEEYEGCEPTSQRCVTSPPEPQS